MMVLALVLGTLVLAGHATVNWVYLMALLTGVASAFDNPARRVLVNELVPERDVANAVSLNSTLMTGSRTVGPAVAGVLVATVGIGWCFVFNGLSFVAVLLALRRMDPSAMRAGARSAKGEKRQLRAGLRYVWATGELRVPLLMLAAVTLLAFNFQVLTPLFAVRTFGGGTAAYTVLASMTSAGAVIGSLWLARREALTTRFLAVACVAFGASSVLFALSPSLVLAAVSGVLVGTTSIVLLSGTNAVLQLRASPEMRGRVLALFTVVFLGSTPIGGPIAGWMAEAFGVRVALCVGAATAILSGVVVLLSTRPGRRPAREAPGSGGGRAGDPRGRLISMRPSKCDGLNSRVMGAPPVATAFRDDPHAAKYRDVVEDHADAMTRVFSILDDPSHRQQLVAAETYGRPALSGVVRDIEVDEIVDPVLASADSLRFRQAVGVAVRLTMEAMGWATTGKKGPVRGSTHFRTSERYAFSRAIIAGASLGHAGPRRAPSDRRDR